METPECLSNQGYFLFHSYPADFTCSMICCDSTNPSTNQMGMVPSLKVEFHVYSRINYIKYYINIKM